MPARGAPAGVPMAPSGMWALRWESPVMLRSISRSMQHPTSRWDPWAHSPGGNEGSGDVGMWGWGLSTSRCLFPMHPAK